LPDKTRELHNRLLAWRKKIKAPMPTPNTPQSLSELPAKKAKGKKKAQAK
jgi:hypothetical protein